MGEQRGFTLVEVVVALTVMSLLVLATLTAVRTLGDTHTRVEATTLRLDEMRLVSQFLRNSLRQAVPVRTLARPGGYLLGGRDELSWIAPLQGVEGVAGLQYKRLFLDGDTLMIQFVPFHPALESPDWAEATAHPLLTDVSEFTLAFRENPQSAWLEQWGEQEGVVPRALKLQLRVRERYWPDLIVLPDLYQAGY
ncbi:MAG: prepilin-type N-terminal cleavage/methylation domain-containing protein [Haliea sp.]|uniref:prepilin-type N-terminal cleavage/methylation domain-containing protein n=1 Tax=Haliea sp. TaxID=1932666 RepID=UPI0032EC28C3